MGGKNSNVLDPSGLTGIGRSSGSGSSSAGRAQSRTDSLVGRTLRASQERADAFIKSLEGDKTISDITRKEITDKFNTREDRLREGLAAGAAGTVGGSPEEQTAEDIKRNQGLQDDVGFLKSLEDEFETAQSGLEIKHKARQTAQRSAELRADRPGILQTRTTKNRPTGGGPTGTPTPIAKRSNK